MRIRTKILLSHAVLALSVALISAVIIVMLSAADHNRRELGASYEQLRNIDLIATEANHYIEQIAELIIIGPQAADIDHARSALQDHIETQKRLITAEIDWLDAFDARAEEVEELRLINRIEDLVSELDGVYLRLSSELQQGNRETADAIYRDEVEERLDEELGDVIEAILNRELREVEQSLAESERLSRQSMTLAIGVIFVVAGVGTGVVLMLNRTVLRPVTDLAEAADAVGRGELSQIVETGSRDELGNLARRLNRMTAQIREQRDALKRSNETLERQVAERTRELLDRSEELERVNSRLREIDSTRTKFFADISHELRTPLTILRGQAEVALRRREPDPEQLRETLEAVVRKVGQMSRLVEDLLFLARSEHGAIEIDLRPVVLQDFIGDVLLDSQALARAKGIVIAPRQPIDPLIVRADADRLRQVLLILLDNAIKFSPERSAVTITLTSEAGCAIIEVSDEGPGFTATERENAFARFYRGEIRRGESRRGAGLGLAIAKWIIDRHSGRIEIGSAPGGGAAITIALPLDTPLETPGNT
ncbi:ATP-binding protein [Marivita sp. GX14005]|uniref:sensor histidine kinase n=1 Tax=Marivita sp. GX14005 TaxID=2942276 RepID=UPI002018C591|nr:ATP-binding protein [Marivita sp. GX14005]MCL3883144.1 ATP-binding protein [Marivita sp. GX14005]